jgi:hypothetical protein
MDTTPSYVPPGATERAFDDTLDFIATHRGHLVDNQWFLAGFLVVVIQLDRLYHIHYGRSFEPWRSYRTDEVDIVVEKPTSVRPGITSPFTGSLLREHQVEPSHACKPGATSSRPVLPASRSTGSRWGATICPSKTCSTNSSPSSKTP